MYSCDTDISLFQSYMFGITNTFVMVPKGMTVQEKSNKCKKILRWVIEDILGWTPEQAKNHFGKKEVDYLKLEPLINKIEFEAGYKKKNYKYLISILYPKEIKYDPTDGIIDIWNSVLSGELKKFPTDIFTYTDEGLQRVYTILDEFNKRYVAASSINDLYKAYSNRSEINKAFERAHLFQSLSKYSTYPIELLHRMIKEKYPGQENNLLYAAYLYNNIQKQAK